VKRGCGGGAIAGKKIAGHKARQVKQGGFTSGRRRVRRPHPGVAPELMLKLSLRKLSTESHHVCQIWRHRDYSTPFGTSCSSVAGMQQCGCPAQAQNRGIPRSHQSQIHRRGMHHMHIEQIQSFQILRENQTCSYSVRADVSQDRRLHF
jgi:hypothetical protein